MQALITCPFGLVSLLSKEMKRLNIPIVAQHTTALLVETDGQGIPLINLRSRIANKVFLLMGEKEVMTFDALFDFVQSLAWKEYLQTDNISLKVTTKNSQLSAIRTLQSVAHKAILSSLQIPLMRAPHEATGKGEKGGSIQKTPPSSQVEIFLHLEENQAKMLLNTSGASLHQRGYRTQAGSAPLKENIAAAMVLLAGWKFKSPLIDPCCGSGTIPIEAALIAKNIAPGLQRTFAFQQFKNYDKELRDNLLREAKAQQFEGNYQIFGADSDENVLSRAKQNAERAGVGDQISFFCSTLGQGVATPCSGSQTWLLTNPPYGKRLSSAENLSPLYQELASALQHDQYFGGVISSFPEMKKLFDSERFSHKTLYNGADKVAFYRKKPL